MVILLRNNIEKSMTKSIYSIIPFILLIAATFTGCNQETIIELMPITDVEIYTTEINTPGIFAVSVLVTGTLEDKCIDGYEIGYDMIPSVFDRIPLYSDNDTISIEIRQKVTVGNVACDLASPYYIDMIFLGFCKSGEYTIDVNGYTETFTVL